MDNMLNFVQSLIISDWILILFAIITIVYGYKRGGAKIIIHSIWFIFGIFLAAYFYENLAEIGIFSFLDNQTTILALNFLIIFIAFFILKLAIYKILSIVAKIHGPCPLNRFLAMLIGFFLAIALSWYITLDVSSLEVIYRFITNDFSRVFLSFLMVFTALMSLVFIFTKLLHIKVGIDRPCPLLVALKPFDGILNAKNINSYFNNFEGVIFGLLQGFVVIILFLIINNHFNFMEISGFLEYFQIAANHTQSVLSDYLSFIQPN